jgi:hypothetical protein
MFDQISEIKHSYENVWQLTFCHNDDAKVASGQSQDKRAIQPLCHSLTQISEHVFKTTMTHGVSLSLSIVIVSL